jgi:hypothetical protein
MSKGLPTKGALLMVTRIKAKRKAKSKPRKQAKAKAGKERRADGLVVGSDGAKLVDAICAKAGATHAELKSRPEELGSD